MQIRRPSSKGEVRIFLLLSRCIHINEMFDDILVAFQTRETPLIFIGKKYTFSFKDYAWFFLLHLQLFPIKIDEFSYASTAL